MEKKFRRLQIVAGIFSLVVGFAGLFGQTIIIQLQKLTAILPEGHPGRIIQEFTGRMPISQKYFYAALIIIVGFAPSIFQLTYIWKTHRYTCPYCHMTFKPTFLRYLGRITAKRLVTCPRCDKKSFIGMMKLPQGNK